MGLLSRASNLDEKIPDLAFTDFILKHSLKFCALLEADNSNYYVSSSVGFDVNSIFTSISTVDFWKGICKETSKIYIYEGSELNPLLQLFSFYLKDNIKKLFVYKNSASRILICQDQLTKEITDDFENINSGRHNPDFLQLNPLIKENSTVLLLKLDFNNSIDNFINSEIKDKIIETESFKNACLNEIYNRFTCFYNSPDATVLFDNNILKTIIVADKAYSMELIKNHLLLNLKDILKESTKLVQIESAGTAASCDKVRSFLQAE